MSYSRSTFIIVAALFGSCSLVDQVRSTYLIPATPVREQILRRDPEDQLCGFAGNSDIYGLGIRLGIYLQWFASVLSKWFLPSNEVLHDVLNENAIFLFSIFIASIVLVSGAFGPVYSVEVVIMLHIFFGSIFTIFVDDEILLKLGRLSSFGGILFKLAVTAGMAALGSWFWFDGVQRAMPTPCGSSIFLFAQVDLYGRAQMFFKVVAIFNAILWCSLVLQEIELKLMGLIGTETGLQELQDLMGGTMLNQIGNFMRGSDPGRTRQEQALSEYYAAFKLRLERRGFIVTARVVHSISMLFVNSKPLQPGESRDPSTVRDSLWFGGIWVPFGYLGQLLWRRVPIGTKTRLQGLTDALKHWLYSLKPSSKTKLHHLGVFFFETITKPFNIFVLIYSILAIELIITWNAISGVYTINSTGQLIPFVIGVAGLWKTLVLITFPKNELDEIRDRATENGDASNAPRGDPGMTSVRQGSFEAMNVARRDSQANPAAATEVAIGTVPSSQMTNQDDLQAGNNITSTPAA